MKHSAFIKRSISILLTAALLLPVTFAAAASDGGFDDVKTGHWAYEYVECAVSSGLFTGVSDTAFEPDALMTRAMFVTVLSRVAGVRTDNGETGVFKDVPAGAYYTGAVNWAAGNGIAEGTGGGEFSPDGAVTREQAATFLYRCAGELGLVLPEGESRSFSDESAISAFAVEAVGALSAAGVVEGYTDGTFRPGQAITRSEAAKLTVCFVEASSKAPNTDPGGGAGVSSGGASGGSAGVPSGGLSGGTSGGVTEPSDTGEYRVTFSASGAGVSVDGRETDAVTVKKGGSLTFTVTPREGYQVEHVTGGAEIQNNGDGTYTLGSVTEDLSIFILAKDPGEHLVTFSTLNAAALVGGREVECVAVPDGGDLTFTARAEDMYEIVSVAAALGEPVANGDGSYTIRGIRDDETVAVTAADTSTPARAYAVKFVTDGGVQVLVDGEEVTSGTAYSDKSYFQFMAKPADGHTAVKTAVASPSGHLNSAGNTWVLTGVTGDTTVTLTTGVRDLRVRFVTGGGPEAQETRSVEYGQTVQRPQDPVRDGYVFGGWYTDASYVDEFDFSQPLTGNLALYALWLSGTEEVHISASGGNGNSGADFETAVYSMDVALKLAELSETKTVYVDTALAILCGEEETWDIPAGVTIKAGAGMKSYDSMMFNVCGKLTVNGGVFDGCGDRKANTGCSFMNIYRVEPGEYGNDTGSTVLAEVTLNDCEVENFGSMPRGNDYYTRYSNCCIYVSGILNVTGGKYHDNIGVNGAVIYVNSPSSKLTVEGGDFYDNTAAYHQGTGALGLGGVIYTANGFTSVDGAKFHGNTGGQGGVIYANIPKQTDSLTGQAFGLDIRDCEFYENKAVGSPENPGEVSANGGAVYISGEHSSGSAVTRFLGDNSFRDNTAGDNGGAIFIGGNRYVGGDVTAQGLTVSGNSADGLGDGIYIAVDNCSVTLDPAAGASDIGDEVYLGGASKLTLRSTVAGMAQPIRLDTAAKQVGRVVAEGLDYTLVQGDLDKLVMADSGAQLELKGNSVVISGVVTGGSVWDETHNMSEVYLNGVTGDDEDGDGASPETAFKTFDRAKAALGVNGVIYVTGTVTVNSPESWSLGEEDFGTARVKRHESFTEGIMVDVVSALTLSDIVLDGNGVTAAGTSSAPANPITVESGGQLILGKDGELTNFVHNNNYGIVYALSGASVTVSGGKLTGNTNNGSTGCSIVYAAYGAQLEVNGCEATGNTLTGQSASILRLENRTGNSGVTFTLDQAVIKDNRFTGSYASAVYAGNEVALTVTGGTFEGNESDSKGYNSAIISLGTKATLTMTGATIKDNTLAAPASNVILATGCEVSVKDSHITGNTTSSPPLAVGSATLESVEFKGNKGSGGSGAVMAATDLTVRDCDFEGNSGSGGIISVSQGTLDIGEGNTFKDNTVTGNGGVISVTGECTVNITGGTFTGNRAGGDGGVFYANRAATINISGGTFTGNHTGGDGGVLYTDTYYLKAVNITGGTFSGNTADGDGNGILVNKGSVVTIAPGEGGLTLTDGIFINNTSASASGSKPVLLGDLKGLNGTLPVGLYNPNKGVVVAKAAPGRTLTNEDKEKLAAVVGSIEFDLDGANIVISNTTPAQSVKLSVEDELTIPEGGTATLTATVSPDAATNHKVTWKSGSGSVVSIVGSGSTVTLKGLTQGQSEITVTTADGGYTDSCTVRVVENTTPAERVTIQCDVEPEGDGRVQLIKGGSLTLTANVEPELAADKSVTWHTENSDIISLAEDGNTAVVTGLREGQATVEVTTTSGGRTDSIDIYVREYKVSEIHVPESIQVKVGEAYPILAVVEPDYASDKTLSWVSDKEGTARVTPEDDTLRATVEGVTPGSTEITVSSPGGVEKKISVTVAEAPAVSNAMRLDLSELELIVHQTFDITALFEDHVEEVSWTSSNDSVVTIDSSLENRATVRALEEGTVTVTASCPGQQKTVVIHVRGAVAGTSDNVYIDGDRGNDSDPGTSGLPVATLDKALSMLAVNGRLHISGAAYVTRDMAISLPKEVYGDARIIIEKNGRIDIRDHMAFISDARIEARSNYGIYIVGQNAGAVLSAGTEFTGSDGRLATVFDGGKIVINGGRYSGFDYSGSYGVIGLSGGSLTVNGGTFESIVSTGAYGALAGAYGAGAAIEVNGGTFTGCGSDRSNSGVFAVMSSAEQVTLRGGSFTDCANIAYVDKQEGLVLDPVYDLSLTGEVNIYSGSILAMRPLGGLEGKLTLTLSRPAPGLTLVSARDRRLSWSDLALFTLKNEGYELELDIENNKIQSIREKA